MRRVGPGVLVECDEADADVDWHTRCAAASVRHRSGALSGEAAGALWSLDGYDPGAAIAVQVERTRSGRGECVVHRRPALQPFVTRNGLVVTDIEETLLNLAADTEPRPGCAAATQQLDVADLLELALESALHEGLTTRERLLEFLADVPRRRRGRTLLRDLLERRGDVVATESYLETRFVQVARAGGLPAFERQVSVEDRRGRFIGRVDFKLGTVVVECLGRKAHDGREDVDLARIADLTAAGYAVLPFRFAHIEHQQHHVLSTTTDALRHAGLR